MCAVSRYSCELYMRCWWFPRTPHDSNNLGIIHLSCKIKEMWHLPLRFLDLFLLKSHGYVCPPIHGSVRWNDPGQPAGFIPCGISAFKLSFQNWSGQIQAFFKKSFEWLFINPALIRNVSLPRPTKQTLISFIAASLTLLSLKGKLRPLTQMWSLRFVPLRCKRPVRQLRRTDGPSSSPPSVGCLKTELV